MSSNYLNDSGGICVYVGSDLDLVVIKKFLLSDNVHISHKESDFSARSSVFFCPLLEVVYGCIYYVLEECNERLSKHWINKLFKGKIFALALKQLGVKERLLNVNVARAQNRHIRIYHGSELKTSYFFGLKVDILKLVKNSTTHKEAMEIIKERVKSKVARAFGKNLALSTPPT